MERFNELGIEKLHKLGSSELTAGLLPGGDGCPFPKGRIRAWIRDGLVNPADPTGERIKLHATRVGGRWYVSRWDLANFLKATAGGSDTPANPVK